METSIAKESFITKIKNEGQSFFGAVSKSNERVYLLLLSFYVLIFLALKVAWMENVSQMVDNIRYGILSVVMWGSTVYLFFIIVEWKKLWKNTPVLIIIGGVLIAITAYFSAKMSTNLYGAVMDVFFCLMACGKSYKKILKCIMWVSLFTIVIAAIGNVAHYTIDFQKPFRGEQVGHSYGIIYPNTWGYIVFLAMMTGWYSYFKGKHILTFAIFWAVSAFMYTVVECRTIAVLSIVFPFFTLGIDWLEKRPYKGKKGVDLLGWFWTITPILAFLFIIIASMNYKWIHANVPDSALLGTVRYRFIHNGLYLKSFGVPIIGNSYSSNIYNYINVNGEFIKPDILDCSYVSYMIMRGAVWMGYTLIWLCVANYKAYKNRDFAINYLSAILLVFAMIERVGLEMWYNFILLYPLATVGNVNNATKLEAYVTVPVLDDVENAQRLQICECTEAEVNNNESGKLATDIGTDELQNVETNNSEQNSEATELSTVETMTDTQLSESE